MRSNATCSIEGCECSTAARGWCNKHYLHWQRYGSPTLGPTRFGTLAERFWSKVDRSGGPDACWPWTAGKSWRGYGMFYHPAAGQNVHSHRVAYALANSGGVLPPRDVVIMHRCDNRPCCNQKHLQAGTVADNTHDMMAKGRMRIVPRSGPYGHYRKHASPG